MRPAKLWAVPASLIVILICGCDARREVEAIKPERETIRESFGEPAKTRLDKTYRVSMPISGRIDRVEFEPGDTVKKGQTLAAFDRAPLEHAVAEAEASVAELKANIKVKEDNRLEEHLRVEAEASLQAFLEALKAADAQVEAEKVQSDYAQIERRRTEELARDDTVSRSSLDDARMRAMTALSNLREQEFMRAALRALLVAVRLGPQAVSDYLSKKALEREVLAHQLAQAQARLARARHDLALARIESPIDGVVLERYELGDRTLSAGHELLLLGDLSQLEVVADVLTQDALRLERGSEVSLQPAADREPLAGRVKRIEPAGFTKLSSLGVEQQRVNVIVRFVEPPKNLGVGYRLEARFFVRAKEDALVVPRYSVMQAPDRSFYVMKVENGRLKKQTVQVGLRNDLKLEIEEGLSQEDTIVSAPDATMQTGDKVAVP